MRAKILLGLVMAIVFGMVVLLGQGIFARHTPSIIPHAGAQEIIGGRVYAINFDTYVITSDQSGRAVYVYYFDAKPEKEESTIKFIAKAIAK